MGVYWFAADFTVSDRHFSLTDLRTHHCFWLNLCVLDSLNCEARMAHLKSDTFLSNAVVCWRQTERLQVFHSGSLPGPDPLTQRIWRISLMLPIAISSRLSMWVLLGLEQVPSNLSCHSSILWGCLWATRKTQPICKQQNNKLVFQFLSLTFGFFYCLSCLSGSASI